MYDIIYKIYFYVDDYNTLEHFWVLNKTFNVNYMQKYNAPYQHRLNVLFHNLCDYLENPENVSLCKLLTSEDLTYTGKNLLKRDLRMLYYAIREFLLKQLETYYSINFIQSVSHSLINIMMMQGYTFLQELFIITSEKSTLTFIPLIDCKGHYLSHLMGSFNRKCTYSFIKTQIKLWETLIN